MTKVDKQAATSAAPETAQAVVMPKTIHECMIAILRDMDAITKSRTAGTGGFKYNFRGIDQVYNTLNPLLCKYGVFMTAKVLSSKREERVNAETNKITAFTSLHMLYRFNAADGSFIETEAEGEGMDSGDKSSNKAMSVAHKYAILQAFCVPTEDIIDPDAEIPGPVAPRPGPALATSETKTAIAAAPGAADPRVKQASEWCEQAVELINEFDTAARVSSWWDRTKKERLAANDFAPDAYTKLRDVVGKRNKALAQPAIQQAAE